jgi:two-component system response regulator HydG
VQEAVDCIQAGAYDYIIKPPDNERLLSSVRRALEASRLRRECLSLKERILSEEIRHPDIFSAIVTQSPSMLACFRYIEAVSGTNEPILITGETGVGKELFARAVHALSRPESPFVAVNVAGLDDHAFSDTLFGHKRGAFTGADERRDGLVKKASGGTLFLDEVGDLAPSSQVKLLRLLQEQTFFPLGSDLPQSANARIVASTNRDLGAMIDSEKFRADLYYRFRTHEARIPPLRERMEDIPLLLHHFLEKSAQKLNKKKSTPPDELLSLLMTYDFPGNVRELEAMTFDAVSNHGSGVLSMSLFRSLIAASEGRRDKSGNAPAREDIPFANLRKLPPLKEVADLLVAEAMRRANGNQSLAAGLLGVSQSALSHRLKKQAKA